MKREREAARLLRKAADILERRKAMASMHKRARKEFPYTREQIEGLQRYLEEWMEKEEKKVKRAFDKYMRDVEKWEKGKGNFYYYPDFLGDDYYVYPFPLDEEFEVKGFVVEVASDPQGEGYDDGLIYSYYVYLTLGEDESVEIGKIYTDLDYGNYRAENEYVPYDYEDIVAEWERDYGED